MTGAHSLLVELQAAGLHLVAQPDGGIHVTPRERLTDALREHIRVQRAELLVELRARAVAGLPGRIKQMGDRWLYGPDDLAEAFQLASRDPDGWLQLVQADEESADKCARAGLLWPPTPVSSRPPIDPRRSNPR